MSLKLIQFKNKKRDIIVVLITFISTILLNSFVFTTNKLIEKEFFTDKNYEFTIEDSLGYLPLIEGNRWVYEGYIEEQVGHKNNEPITEKEEFDNYEVTAKEVIKRADALVVLIENSFSILSLEEIREKKRCYELWFITGGKIYTIQNSDLAIHYFQQIKNKENVAIDHSLVGLKWEFPFYVDKKYDFFQEGGFIWEYNWYKKKITESKKLNIAGVIYDKECFKIENAGVGFTQSSWFCPGMGEVEYDYHHNGAVTNVHYILKNSFIKY